jgi:hypothetical protein
LGYIYWYSVGNCSVKLYILFTQTTKNNLDDNFNDLKAQPKRYMGRQ